MDAEVTFLGESRSAREIRALIKRVAPTDSKVLILGESGTGKEVVAQSIHQQSRRSSRDYFIANCAAFPPTLFDSEFFGHVKGSFTGADQKRDGLLKRADKATLFLDELGELSEAGQAKLLRAIELGEAMPVGSSKAITFDTRMIFATNEDIEAMVLASQLPPSAAKGSGQIKRMRADFFYRLGGIQIKIPPLRDRLEDLEILSEHCLRRICAKEKKPLMTLSPEAKAKLAEHSYPGNVRELHSILERAVVWYSSGEIQADHIEYKPWKKHWAEMLEVGLKLIFKQGAVDGLDLKTIMQSCENLTIQLALKKHDGNEAAVASELGITKKALRTKMVSLDLV